jgi:hypothetical protein
MQGAAVVRQGVAPATRAIGPVKNGASAKDYAASLQGVSPASGSPLRNTASINGTGLVAKGNGPAKIGATPKSGANVNGTSVRPKN